MIRETISVLLGSMVVLISISAIAQEGGGPFRPPSASTERFRAWRGADRLPKVNLEVEPGKELPSPPFTDFGDLLRVRGGLGYETQFSDNPFLVRGGEIPGRHERPSDIFYIISPNVHLEVPGGLAPIIVDYTTDITQAGSFHEFNTDEHFLSGIMDVKVGHGLGFRVRDALSHQSSPPTFPARRAMWVDPATGGVDEYDPAVETRHLLNYFWTNSAEFVGYYKSPDRLRIEGRFQHDLARFEAERNWAANYDRDTVGGELSYRILPKVSFLSEYYHDWDTAFNREHDRLVGGLEWDISAKLNGMMTMGYEWFHVKSAPNVGGLVAHAELTYDVTSKLRVGFYGDRGITETTLVGEGPVVNSRFESTSLSLDGMYRLTQKLDFTSGISYIRDHTGPGVVNELWVTSAGFRWRPRDQWAFEAKYQFQKYEPFMRQGCYEENLFIINAAYGF